MKYRFLFIPAIILFLVGSCKKNGGHELTIKLASISNNLVPINGSTSIILNFTDNSGAPIDSIYMIRIRINQDSASVPVTTNVFNLTPASYPQSVKGQLQIDLSYNGFLVAAISPPTFGNPPQNESDSLIFRFAVKDISNNKSDTINTPLIVVMR